MICRGFLYRDGEHRDLHVQTHSLPTRRAPELCGLPLLEADIPAACDNDTYEAAMAGALAETESRWPGLHTAAFGDLLLEDIRAWRQAHCARVGRAILTPLFGADTAQLAREKIRGGPRAALFCVDPQPLDAPFSVPD